METKRMALETPAEIKNGFLIPCNRPGSRVLQIGEFFMVGRDTSNHLVIHDSFVSSRHARIEQKNGTYVLRDMHSRNGTFLNGSRVSEAYLTPGDRLSFGESSYVFSETMSDRPALTSKNPAWAEQLARLPTFASTDFPVLITGPSGSGKEILARAVHGSSPRVRGPFVSINCSALGESLIESELFGHTRGSFTGATHDRKGAFETARTGTLFLDEIGDLPLVLQPKLLRAIENREIRPVGSDRTIETDVRIIAATHKDLPIQVQTGRFREDLYYRLNVCQLHPPALTERPEDFEDLLYHFARQMRVRFSFNAIQKLKDHSWPGNVRELKNTIARASAYFPGKYIQPEDLPGLLDPVRHVPEASLFLAEAAAGTGGSVIKEIEREMIVSRLIANRGNQKRTAQDLGLPKSTLHDRIRTYSIDLEKLCPSLEGRFKV